MNSKNRITQRLSVTQFCFPLLMTVALLCWALPAQAQNDTWTGAGSDANWSTAANWQANVAPANGDNLTFPSGATSYSSANDLNGLNINQMSFSGSGYDVSGNDVTITNGISDTTGNNTNSINLTLGQSQTIQNNSGNIHIENGTIGLDANVLTVAGGGPVSLNGAISSANSGQLIDNNSSVTTLGGANSFGLNNVSVTSTFTPTSTNTTVTIYTNSYVVEGVSTNYTYVTNPVTTVNGTWAYTTNVLGPQNPEAVVVQQGTLSLGNAGALPSGANVGNVSLENSSTLDLNGQSPTVNGLDSSSYGTFVDNLNSGDTGLYTLTVGTGNSNSVFNGTIGNSVSPGGATYGSIGLTKTGYGTFTLMGANQYGGPTKINQGTLVVGAGASLGTYSSEVDIAPGAVLDVSANDPSGYVPLYPLTVAAGTPTDPYTNFLGSYDPNVSPNYVVTITGENDVLTYQTNVVAGVSTNVMVTTNFVSYNYATNTIISVVDADVVGNFSVTGGGSIAPVTPLAPNIATWKIDGDLTFNEDYTPERNRITYLLNDTTTPGGGTNTLVDVTGNLTINGELDFVITPVAGSLAAGDYTLIRSGGYTDTGGTLKLVEQRGLVGDTISAVNNNIVLHSLGGSATPGDLVWAGTPANNNWDVDQSQNWVNNGTNDVFYALDNVTFNDSGVGTIAIPSSVQQVVPGSMTFNNNQTNIVFAQSADTWIVGAKNGLIVNGPGSVTLQNPNKFSGDVIVNGGTLIPGYFDTSTTIQHTIYNGVAPHDLYLAGGALYEVRGAANTEPYATFENLHIQPGASALMQQGRTANEFPVYQISNSVTRAVGGVFNAVLTGKGGRTAGIYFMGTNSPDGTADYGENGIVGGWATYNYSDWLYANNDNTTARGGNMAYFGYQTDNNPGNWGATSNVQVSGSASGIGTQTINSLKIETGSDINLGINSGQTLTVASGGILVPTASAPRSDTITGGTLKGASGQDLIVLNNNIVAGSSLTIGSVIADNGGASGLTTAGGGMTILTGNNTYTGPTYIDNGFASGAPGSFNAPGTLQVGDNGTSGDISQSSAVIDNGTLAFSRSDNVTVNGAISGTGNLAQNGAGVLTLAASNTVSGQVTVANGTLQVGNGGTAGSINNVSGIVDNGTLVFNTSGTVTPPGIISGIGNLVQFGSGNLVLSAAETYSGNTVVSNGTVTLTASGSLPNTAGIVVEGGATLDASAVSGGLTLRGAAPAETLTGSGTVNGSVTTAVGTTLVPGTDGTFGTLTINNNLDLEGGSYVFDVTGTNYNAAGDRVVVGGNLTLGAGTLIIHVVGAPLTPGIYPLFHVPSGTVNGSVANLGVFGLGSQHVSLQIDTLNHDVDLLVSASPITALTWVGGSSGNAWNSSVANWTTGTGTTTYANPEIVTFDDSGSASPPVDIQANVSPTVVTNSANTKNYVLGSNSGSAGKIAGGASLVKTGTAQLTLQTVNTYLGDTTIGAGTVQLGDNTAAAEDGMVGNGGQVTLGASASLVANNAGTEQLSGPLSGSGSLTQQGSGTLVLAGDNSGFSGPIMVGTTNSSATNVFLQMGNGASGTLGTGTVTLGTGSTNSSATLLFDVGPTPSSQVAVNADIAGSGGITNLGAGIVTLNGNNTFGGLLANDTGTIQLGSDNALPSGTPVYMDDSEGGSVGTLDLNDHNATVSSLQGNNTGIGTSSFEAAKVLNNGSGTATLTINGGGTYTWSGQWLDNNNGGAGKLAVVVNNNTFLNLYPGYNSARVPSPNLFSGGLTISNATVHFGDGGQSTDRNNGQNAAGLGMITLEGGLGTNIDGDTGLPTNGIILPAQYYTGGINSSHSEYNTYPTIYVPAGQSGSIFCDGYGGLIFPLIGSGTLTIQPSYVRDQIGGDWSQFTGTIIFQGVNFSDYGVLTTPETGVALTGTGTSGSPLATFYMHTNNVTIVGISAGSEGPVFQMGALAGGDNTSELGGSAHNAGSKQGNRATTWVIGSLGLSTTNGSRFVDSDCGVRVIGGSLTLTNNTLSFGGELVVSNSTLALAPLGVTTNITVSSTNYVPITYQSNSDYLVCTPIEVVGSGMLDLSQVGDNTLYLGHNGAQTLYGNGTINGNLASMNSLIAPALRADDSGVYPGQLTVTGDATIDSGTTFQMAVSPSGYDSLSTGGTLTVNQAALVVTTTGGAFANGSSNVFRFFAGPVPVGSTGITNITVPDVANSYWVTNLTVDGSMALVNTNAAVIINPASPPLQVSFNAGAQTLSLGWPTNSGWILQAQTNDSSVGLSATGWVDVTGTTTPTNEVIIINPNSPSVFYRLRHP